MYTYDVVRSFVSLDYFRIGFSTCRRSIHSFQARVTNNKMMGMEEKEH